MKPKGIEKIMKQSELNELKVLREDSLDYRKWLYPDDTWDQLEDYWFAKQQVVTDQILPIPLMVGDAQRAISQLLGGVPRPYVSSDGPDFVAQAQVMTKIFTQLIEDRGLYRQIRLAIQDCITLGTGFLLDGYGSMYGVHPEVTLEGNDPSVTDTKDQDNIEYNDDVESDMPWTLRVHPSDILLPPGSVDIRSAYGFFHRIARPKEEVKEDEKYIKEHRNAVQPNAQVEYRPPGVGQQNYHSVQEMVVLYDWYDMRNYHRVTFSPDYPHALQDDVDELLIRLNRLPLHEIIFNENGRYFWGTADFTFLEPMQKELTDIHTQMRRHRRVEIAKGFVDRNKFSEDGSWETFDEAVKKMTTDEVMTLIPVDGDPSNVIAEFIPHAPVDLLPQAENIKRQSREWLGMGDNQRGQMSTGRHTRGEANITESRSQQSMMPRRNIIKLTIQEILYNWSQMIFDFWVEPKTIQVYDARGQKVMVEYAGSDLRGDYSYQISLESLRSQGQEQRIAESMGIFYKLSPMAGPMGSGAPIDINSLLQQFLSRLYSDWDIEALMPNAPRQPIQTISFDAFRKAFNQPMPQGPMTPPGPPPMGPQAPPQMQQPMPMPGGGMQ